MGKFPVFLEFNKSAGVFQCKVLDQPYLNNVGCSNAGKVRYFKRSKHPLEYEITDPFFRVYWRYTYLKLSIQNAYTGLYQFSITNAPIDNFVHSSDFHELMPERIGTLSMDSPKCYYNENHP